MAEAQGWRRGEELIKKPSGRGAGVEEGGGTHQKTKWQGGRGGGGGRNSSKNQVAGGQGWRRGEGRGGERKGVGGGGGKGPTFIENRILWLDLQFFASTVPQTFYRMPDLPIFLRGDVFFASSMSLFCWQPFSALKSGSTSPTKKLPVTERETTSRLIL